MLSFFSCIISQFASSIYFRFFGPFSLQSIILSNSLSNLSLSLSLWHTDQWILSCLSHSLSFCKRYTIYCLLYIYCILSLSHFFAFSPLYVCIFFFFEFSLSLIYSFKHILQCLSSVFTFCHLSLLERTWFLKHFLKTKHNQTALATQNIGTPTEPSASLRVKWVIFRFAGYGWVNKPYSDENNTYFPSCFT